jgi:type II secretion system protein G
VVVFGLPLNLGDREVRISLRRREHGFTIIELMIVVLIIGIIAAIAVPNLLIAIERARQRRSMSDMRSIATAWEARSVETGRYNAAAQAASNSINGADQLVDITSLGTALAPTYIKILPQFDGWNNPFLCYTNETWGAATQATTYVIIAPGRDRVIAGIETLGAFSNFDCDIVYSNGSFLTYPEGTSTK